MSDITTRATAVITVSGKQAREEISRVEVCLRDAKAELARLQESMADKKAIQQAHKNVKMYERQLDELKLSTDAQSEVKKIWLAIVKSPTIFCGERGSCDGILGDIRGVLNHVAIDIKSIIYRDCNLL